MPYFYPAEAFGGPVKIAFEVGRELVKRGHEVVVFSSDAKDLENRLDVEKDEVEGMMVYYFGNLSMFLVKWSKLFITPELPKKMKSDLKSFDIIHAHEYTTYQNIIVHKFAKRYRIPYVLQAHGSLPKVNRKTRKWLYDVLFGSNLLRDASKVIALSQAEVEQYKCADVPNHKIVLIPNGIDLSEYAHLPSKGSFRKNFNVQGDKKIILYLGRIHKTKGVDFLINAYAYLIKTRKCSDSMLVIAGPDDGYLAEAKSLVSSLEISRSVLFTGFLNKEDKLAAFVDADVFVTPTFSGFPITFLEACSAGTPIITTTLGDSMPWINNNVGYVSKPTTSDLADAAHAILSNDNLKSEFSKNCKDTVRSTFSIEKIVDKMEMLYREVL